MIQADKAFSIAPGYKPTRMVYGYGRVSGHEQETSLAAQRAICESWFDGPGKRILGDNCEWGGWFEDEAVSGAATRFIQRRAGYDVYVRLRHGDVLLVSKPCRLMRSPKDFLEVDEILGQKDIRVVAVELSMDTGTDMGRKTWEMFTMFAGWEIQQMRDRIKSAKAFRRSQGKVMRGCLPPRGWKTIGKSKYMAIDPIDRRWCEWMLSRTRLPWPRDKLLAEPTIHFRNNDVSWNRGFKIERLTLRTPRGTCQRMASAAILGFPNMTNKDMYERFGETLCRATGLMRHMLPAARYTLNPEEPPPGFEVLRFRTREGAERFFKSVNMPMPPLVEVEGATAVEPDAAKRLAEKRGD